MALEPGFYVFSCSEYTAKSPQPFQKHYCSSISFTPSESPPDVDVDPSPLHQDLPSLLLLYQPLLLTNAQPMF